jgi:hypothetical protein
VPRPDESTDYSVNVFPLYDDEGKTGDLCAYAHSPNLKDAMLEAASLTEHWIRAEADDDEPDREPCGFEITVSMPSFPDPA